ncbi:MAG: NADH-quinone oxidoreductase subunit J [Pirellula sp.]|jgi:NADH-quinone oxidoreductase subunit J
MESLTLAWPLAQQAFDPSNLPLVTGLQIDGHFSKAMLLVIVVGAVAYWLLQRGVVRSKPLAIAGALLFGLACVMAFSAIPKPTTFPAENTFSDYLEPVVKMCFCLLAAGGGLGFIVAREPVHAALGFATCVLSTCGILFMQHAYFIAAATMIVYAGATIIIFLFVLMFAQQTKLRIYDVELIRPAVAAFIATALLITITYSVSDEGEILPTKMDLTRSRSLAAVSNNPETELPPVPQPGITASESAKFVPSKTSGLGRAMYTDYLLAIELAGTVLLVATIGAIALAQKPEEGVS